MKNMKIIQASLQSLSELLHALRALHGENPHRGSTMKSVPREKVDTSAMVWFR